IVTSGVDSRTLFDDALKITGMKRLSETIDGINLKYGKHSLHLAASGAAMIQRGGHARNDLAWRKKQLLKGESFRRRLNIPLLKLEPTEDS
ncbi:MAG: DUF4113 domain-containing protein, partial [Candidatus Omnitrophica bacterium]|nr:DUF4113 domain-containing protein [Candidatus Omnitrophota bacterium]